MSKILRRPMFRGGGQVSSYGNGITAPLVPGYKMGGNVSGGIVDLPGGYALTANQRLLNNINNDFPNLSAANSGNITLGSELLAAASNKFPKSNAPIPGVVEEDKTTTTNEVFDDEIRFPEDDDLLTTTKSKIVEDSETGDKKTIQVYDTIDGLSLEAQAALNKISASEYAVLKKAEEEAAARAAVGGRNLEEDAEIMQANYDEREKIDAMNAMNEAKQSLEGGEKTEISAKDAIAENQELFKELLGSKKARGQDISDMLLRFSGSQGNTVGEKFQNYTRAESAAGPGRGEKINQTAAALAINDYVAGKRSKEQVEGMKSQIDYKAKVEGERTKVLPGEDWRGALAKTSLRTKESSGSTGVIRDTLKDLFKKPVATIETTLTKIDKNNGKDLAVGFNIVTGKDGKFIIEKFTDGTYKARTDLLI